MANHPPVDIDPKELVRVQNTWASFVNVIKWSTIVSAAILLLLAWLFV